MKKMEKVLSILLVLSLVLSYVPTVAFAAAEDNLCEHHSKHTAECGYVEAVAGSDCTHDHDEACGYAEPVAEVPCGCTETDESGALVHTEGCGYVAPVAGSDCTHTHDENCGYAAAVEGHACEYVCEECKEQEEPQSDATVEAVQAQINALPTVEEVSVLSYDEKVALYNGAYMAAGNAYNALNEEQKSAVDAEKLMALADYYADPSNLQTLEEGHTCNDITWTGITSMGSYLSSGNYYLQNDIQCTSNITINSGTVNLCLNGKSLTSNNAKPKKITINSGATLNIYDCVGTGSSSLVIENNGTLNIHRGQYIADNLKGSYQQLIKNEGTLHIYNATMKSDRYVIQNKGNLIIEGGSFETTQTDTGWPSNCINNDGGTATINGGSFISSSSHTIYNGGSTGKMTINGGTFSNTGANSALYVPGGTCTITNGTFSAGNSATILTGNTGTCKISGGTFQSSSGKYVLERFYGQGSIEVSGGTFSTNGSGAKIWISNDGLSGGKFTNGIEGYSNLAKYLAEGYACYQNDKICTLTTTQKSITGDTVEVKKITYPVTVTADPTAGGTVTGAGSYAEGEEVTLTVTPADGYELDTLTVTDANSNALTVTDNKFTMPASNVTVNAVFKLKEHKHALNGSGELTWKPITELSEITGPGNYYLDGKLDLGYYNRTISGNGEVNLCLNGVSVDYKYAVTVAAGTTLNICDCGNSSIGVPVENKGTTNIYSGSFTKIIENYSTLNIYNGSFITSDSTASVHNNENGTLNIQNGTFKSTSGNAVENDGGSITISNGSFEAIRCGVFNDDGTLKISGGTYTGTGSYATVDVDGGSAEITGGTFTSGSPYVLRITASAKTLTVTNGSFTSSGDAVCGNAGTLEIKGGTFKTTGDDKNVLVANATVNVSGGTFTCSNEDKAWIKRGETGKFQLSGGTFTGGLRLNLTNVSAGGDVLPESLVDGYAYYQNGEVYEFTTGVNTQIIKGGDVTVALAPVTVTGITLNKTTLSLNVGEAETLTATVIPDNATNKNVTWTSSDETVATVDTTGKVTALKAGAATITVATEDGGKTATCEVEVIAEYPIWVAGTQVTSKNMNDILGDGTVSYDPATLTLTLDNANIEYSPEAAEAAIRTTYGSDVTVTITGSGTITAGNGSGIYSNSANVQISGGTFTISGSTNGIFVEKGSLTIDGAQVKAVGTNKGAHANQGTTTANDGGLLSVAGNNATVRGSYAMGEETFDTLTVAANATLIIEEDAIVTVNQRIDADVATSKIQINGTLKVPAGSGHQTMSGGTLYIGTKGYQWDSDTEKYYCISHDWTYTASGATITASCACGIPDGTLEITAESGTYNGSAFAAELKKSDNWAGGEITDTDILYAQKQADGTWAALTAAPVDAGSYKASITVGEGSNQATAFVEYTISSKSLAEAEVTLSDTVIFKGQDAPTVTVKLGDKTLDEADYTVAKTEDGSVVTVTVNGAGNYTGTAAAKPTYLVVDLPDPKDVEPDDKDAIDAHDRYVELNETYKDEDLAKALAELKAALTAYDIIYQSAKSYVKGSGKTLTFTANGYYAEYGSYVDGAYGKFVSVEIDGKTLDAANYTVVAGSTVITLKTSYLESLSAGKHYIKVNYIDGSTDGEDVFRISINNGNPFTGDDSHMLLWGGLAMASLLCAAMAVMLAGKKKGKYQR